MILHSRGTKKIFMNDATIFISGECMDYDIIKSQVFLKHTFFKAVLGSQKN